MSFEKKVKMEEKENNELQTELLKEEIELIKAKKEWKSRIIFLTITIIIMILTLIIIASKY